MAGGHENLIPLNRRTKEEQREIVTKGGIASGKVRSMKRIALELLEAGAGDEILQAMIRQAVRGNVRAAEFVRDTSGQKPKDEIEVKDVTDRARRLEELVRGK